MNDFSAHMDVFYELRKDFSQAENFEGALAMDTIIDLFDNLMKGKPWAVGMANFTQALKNNMAKVAMNDDELAAYSAVLELI